MRPLPRCRRPSGSTTDRLQSPEDLQRKGGDSLREKDTCAGRKGERDKGARLSIRLTLEVKKARLLVSGKAHNKGLFDQPSLILEFAYI